MAHAHTCTGSNQRTWINAASLDCPARGSFRFTALQVDPLPASVSAAAAAETNAFEQVDDVLGLSKRT